MDEVTGAKGPWPENVKRLRDSDPHFSADTVILTGSSATQFEEARKHLAGRRHAERSDRTLFPMGFMDVCRALDIEMPESPNITPATLADSEMTPTQTQTILRSITSSLSSLYSVEGLAAAVHVAYATARARLDALRRAFVAFPVHREQGLAPRPRAEIDFVSPAFARTCLESKFVDRTWGRAFQTIEASGRRTGIVATRSGTRRHEGGWALPAGLLPSSSGFGAGVKVEPEALPDGCRGLHEVIAGADGADEVQGRLSAGPGEIPEPILPLLAKIDGVQEIRAGGSRFRSGYPRKGNVVAIRIHEEVSGRR